MSRQHSCRGTCRISEQNDDFKNPIAPCQECTRCYRKTVFSLGRISVRTRCVILTRYSGLPLYCQPSWWRHQMETFSALLAICAGNSPVPGEFPTQRPVTRGFDVFFDLRPNNRLSKQWWSWWFETPTCPLWRHRNVSVLYIWKVIKLEYLFHGMHISVTWFQHCLNEICEIIICWYIIFKFVRNSAATLKMIVIIRSTLLFGGISVKISFGRVHVIFLKNVSVSTNQTLSYKNYLIYFSDASSVDLYDIPTSYLI